MSRRLRHVPKAEPYEAGTLVEVTCRTIHGRYLLRPSDELNEIVIGVLGYAQQSCPISICGITVASNHYHLLAVVKETKELSDFMCLFNSNLAREVGRLVDWPDKVWARRYQGIVVSSEEEAQIKRLKYLLAHGAKEALVDHPEKWPGVNSVRALLHGEALSGYWFDRTKEYRARRRGKKFDRLQFATEMKVKIDPLPCWRGLDPEEVQHRVVGMIDEIVKESTVGKRWERRLPAGSWAQPTHGRFAS